MRLIRLLIGTVIVFALVLIGGFFLIPGEKIAQMAADEISRRTGRDVQIGGAARVTFWPELGITADGLKIANAPWSENGPMFQAKSVTIGVDAAALLKREVRIRALTAQAPEILLERNRQGVGNWEVTLNGASGGAAQDATAPAGTARPTPITLDRAEVTGASVYFIDAQAGTEISQRNFDLVLAYPDDGGAADVDLTLRPAGDPVRLRGVVADVAGLAGGDISPLSLTVEMPGAKGKNTGASSLATLSRLVSAGFGLTLLPEMALKTEAQDLTVMRFAAPEPYRTIGLVRRATSPRAEWFEALAALIIDLSDTLKLAEGDTAGVA